MSEAEQAWEKLAQRAMQSKFSGITADTDDLLADIDIREGKLSSKGNHSNAGQNAGGPMMPPMMMGGMGGMGGAGAAAAPRMGTAAAPAAATVGPTPQVGPQAVQPQHLAAGPAAAGVPSGLPSGGPGGPGLGGGLGDSAAESEPPAEEAVAESSSPTPDGVIVDNEQLTNVAALWVELSETFKRLSSEMYAPKSLGLLHETKPKTDELSAANHQWCSDAANEFESIGAMLVDSARSYENAEGDAIQVAKAQEQ